MTPRLVGLRGGHAGRGFDLGAETMLGRDASNGIACPDDSSVSRRHARISSGATGVVVEDLGSSNGTYVNGARIHAPTPLNPGDELTAGGQTFRFESEVQVSAGLTSAPFPPPSVKRAEVSRGEQPSTYQPRPEVPRMPDLSGCAMPRLDLPDTSGCLRFLMLFLLAMVALAVIGGLLMLARAGLGMLGGNSGSAGAGPGRSSTGSSGGSGGGQQDDGKQKEKDGIRVISANLTQVWSSAERVTTNRILITWENATKTSVRRVWASISYFDASGVRLGTSEEVKIYDAEPVEPGARHSDLPTNDQGTNVPDPWTGASRVEVDPTHYE